MAFNIQDKGAVSTAQEAGFNKAKEISNALIALVKKGIVEIQEAHENRKKDLENKKKDLQPAPGEDSNDIDPNITNERHDLYERTVEELTKQGADPETAKNAAIDSTFRGLGADNSELIRAAHKQITEKHLRSLNETGAEPEQPLDNDNQDSSTVSSSVSSPEAHDPSLRRMLASAGVDPSIAKDISKQRDTEIQEAARTLASGELPETFTNDFKSQLLQTSISSEAKQAILSKFEVDLDSAESNAQSAYLQINEDSALYDQAGEYRDSSFRQSLIEAGASPSVAKEASRLRDVAIFEASDVFRERPHYQQLISECEAEFAAKLEEIDCSPSVRQDFVNALKGEITREREADKAEAEAYGKVGNLIDPAEYTKYGFSDGYTYLGQLREQTRDINFSEARDAYIREAEIDSVIEKAHRSQIERAESLNTSTSLEPQNAKPELHQASERNQQSFRQQLASIGVDPSVAKDVSKQRDKEIEAFQDGNVVPVSSDDFESKLHQIGLPYKLLDQFIVDFEREKRPESAFILKSDLEKEQDKALFRQSLIEAGASNLVAIEISELHDMAIYAAEDVGFYGQPCGSEQSFSEYESQFTKMLKQLECSPSVREGFAEAFKTETAHAKKRGEAIDISLKKEGDDMGLTMHPHEGLIGGYEYLCESRALSRESEIQEVLDGYELEKIEASSEGKHVALTNEALYSGKSIESQSSDLAVEKAHQIQMERSGASTDSAKLAAAAIAKGDGAENVVVDRAHKEVILAQSHLQAMYERIYSSLEVPDNLVEKAAIDAAKGLGSNSSDNIRDAHATVKSNRVETEVGTQSSSPTQNWEKYSELANQARLEKYPGDKKQPSEYASMTGAAVQAFKAGESVGDVQAMLENSPANNPPRGDKAVHAKGIVTKAQKAAMEGKGKVLSKSQQKSTEKKVAAGVSM